MTVKVSRNHLFYAFAAENQPAIRVQQGETVLLETHDCFEGQIQKESDLLDKLDWERVNPATGPVYIEDAKPGDILCVDILEVNPGMQSVVCAVPDAGILGEYVTQFETAVLEHEGDQAIFKNRIRIPMKPMIGVIGVTPAHGSINNGTPGEHGGNMDCTIIIGAGAKLYLTVEVDGALFGAGDLHSVMGDGEIVVTGAETPGEIKVNLKTMRMTGLPTPFNIETDEVVAVIVSAKTVDEAAKLATARMSDFLQSFAGLSLNDAGMLMSLGWNLRFCQIVDPLMTVRFEFPKAILKQIGFEMPR